MLRRVFGSARWSTNRRGSSRAVLALLVPRRGVAGALSSWCWRSGRSCCRSLLPAQFPSHAPPPPRARVQNNTEVTVGRAGSRPYSVDGIHPQRQQSLRPACHGYPADNPTTGFTPKDEGFAGVIHGEPTDGSPDVRALLHRHQHRHVGRHRLLPGDVGRRPRSQRRLRGATPQRVLPPPRPPNPPMADRHDTKRPPPCRRPSGSSAIATC